MRATFLVRAVIVTALLGHWVANVLFDRDQYAGADSELLARLDDPMLVQATLGLLVMAILSIRDRHRNGSSHIVDLGRVQLAVLLVGLQLLLFIGLESSERLAVDVFAGGQADVGIFGSGFVAELLVAVGSALILTFLAEVTKRFLSLFRPGSLRADQEHGSLLSLGFAPCLGVLSGAGGVRAPPS
jgi:hypothetical protein